MSKFTDPVHGQLDPKEVARWTAIRRRRDGVAQLPEGFSFRPSGRDGFIYYRKDHRILELYWEMSGLDDQDIILFLRGLRQWVLPVSEAVDLADQRGIEAALRQWLTSNNMRASINE